MPIDPIILQRRHTEVGRIRIGAKTETTNGRTRPTKLDRFRFTSPNANLIAAVADLYGGDARPWDNNGLPHHEVFTNATEVPIIVVRGAMSQWMETWSGGGCVHRCDGVRTADGTECNPDDPQHLAAKPTTRLAVMLRQVETMGVWRLETHGYNAAAELPNVAELAGHVSSLVPAVMRLEERRAIVDGKTSRFVVPTIDLLITKDRLLEVVGGHESPAIAAAAAQQIAAAPATAPAQEPQGQPTPMDVYGPQIAACDTVEALNALWATLRDNGHTFDDVVDAWKARARAVMATQEQADPAAEDVPVAAEVVDEDPPAASDPGADDAAWQAVMNAAGSRGITLTELTTMFEQWAGHPVDDGVADEYRRFITEAL